MAVGIARHVKMRRMIMTQDESQALKAELHEKKVEVIALRKKVKDLEDTKSHEYLKLQAEYRASERFREEARKRCIRFEKIMFLAIDKVMVDYEN